MASIVPVLSDLQSGTVTSSGCAVTMDATFSLIEITTTTASESFTFPATGTVDVSVDWGDGSAVETFTTTPISHTYTTADTYTVKISGSIGGLTIDGSGSESQFAGQFVGAGLTWTGTSFLSAFRDSNVTSCDLSLSDTSLVTNFNSAWYLCRNLTSFPLIDTSSATSFNSAWRSCSGLTSFPLIDASLVTDFSSAWRDCSGLTSFPLLDTSSGTNFFAAWYLCSGLTSFPLIDTSSATSFNSAWRDCSGLTSFPANMFDTCPCTDFTNAFLTCALTQSSVDNILVSIDAAGQSNGTLNITGGTSSAPSATGLAAKTSLREGKGWAVTTN